MPSLNLGPNLATLKTQAAQRIDAAAEVARLRFLTPGAGQAIVYAVKEAEARAYVADPNGSGSFDFLAAEVEAQADAGQLVSLDDVAAEVIAQADAWRYVGSLIERLRRGAKLKVDQAATPAEIRAAEQIEWPTP